MEKITVQDFTKKVNDLKAGEHISVKLIEDGYIITAFATIVKGDRYHFMMLDGHYGNCEMGFEGFQEQGILEYIEYVQMLSDETSDIDIEELLVVEEVKNVKYEITLIFGEEAVREYDEDWQVDKDILLESGDIVTSSFDTVDEMDAYIRGVNEAIAWNDVTQSFNEKHKVN